MDYGVKIVNDSNTVQIGQDYTNVALLRKIRLYKNEFKQAEGTLVFAYEYALTLDGREIFAALRSESDKVFLCTKFSGGKLRVWYNDLWVKEKENDKNGFEWVDVYIFGYPKESDIPTREKYGLRVFNNQGKIAYDSRLKYMKLLGTYNNAKKKDNDHMIFWREKRGRKVAVVIGASPSSTSWSDWSVLTQYETQGGVMFDERGLVLQESSISGEYESGGVGMGDDIENNQWSLLFVDVTGY